MNNRTLSLLIRDERILLGMKKRDFGEGKYNGFGGGVKEEETIEQAAVREVKEEAGLNISEEDLERCAELFFTFPYAQDKGWDQIVHVFIVRNWQGEPKETDEMAYEWFPLDQIPYHQMWDADQYWIPLVLGGKRIRGSFVFNSDNETIGARNITEY